MVTRAERVDAAIETAGDAEDVLWALALNDRPVRRAYLVQVTGLRDDIVVKVLARLANREVIRHDDGLTFTFATPELREEVSTRIPDRVRRQLHELSLRYASEHGAPWSLFEAIHALGADRRDEAARHLLGHFESHDGHDARDVAWLKRVFEAFDLETEGGEEEVQRLGVLLAEKAGPSMKPRTLAAHVTRMKATGLLPALEARLDRALEVRRAAAGDQAGRATAGEDAAP